MICFLRRNGCVSVRRMHMLRPYRCVLTAGRTWRKDPSTVCQLNDGVPVRCLTFWEPDKKSGYKPLNAPPDYLPWKEAFSMANVRKKYNYYRREVQKFRQEMREHFRQDPIEYLQNGDVKMIFDFRSDPEKNEQWMVTADSDYGHGKSRGEFHVTDRATGMWTGNLDTRLIEDGYTKAAGYCNLRTPYKMKSFNREDLYDFTNYTHLVFKIRGDGRSYMINLQTRGHFDVYWNDLYQYPLYTRGGPYWQYERVPFSKFFFSHKGRIQDLQDAIDLFRIDTISITCGDQIDGPFQLEIDYIAVEWDANHKEEFAYELYSGRRYESH